MSIHLDHQTLGSGVLQPGPANLPAMGPQGQPLRPRRSPLKTAARFTMTAITSSLVVGLGLVVVGVAAERLAPMEWRPSTLIGAFAGREEAARILTSIEAKRAEFAMQQEETARAQQEVVVVQANNERVTKAYEALYQRGNMLAQQWAEGAKQTLILDTQGKLEALRGRAEVSQTKDKFAMWCDIGSLFSPDINCGDTLRASAKSDRGAMSAEIVANFKAQSAIIATSLQDWSQGIPDPAQLVVYKNKIEQLHPLPRAPVPPGPIPPATTS